MKLSVIITLHDEGLVAEKTICSLLLALEKIAAEYEVILHLDEASAETEKVAEKYRSDQRFRVFENKFKDVGPARNFAAEKARGEYLIFVDGDDLVSENYVVETLKLLENSDAKTTVRPEYSVEFEDNGQGWALFRMEDSGERKQDAYKLFNVNLWIVAIAGRREIFLEHKYPETCDGYGHEDYTMNIQLVEEGVKQKIAPGTIYFHRMKAESRQKRNEAERNTQPYSELFAAEYWRTFPVEIGDDRKTWRARIKKIYVKTKKVLGPVAKIGQTVIGRKMLTEKLPDDVAVEWDKTTKIEPKTARKARKMNAVGIMGVNPHLPASMAYLKICREYVDFREIDIDKFVRGMDERNLDLLMSRIVVQARGKASFRNEKIPEKWEAQHKVLAKKLGI